MILKSACTNSKKDMILKSACPTTDVSSTHVKKSDHDTAIGQKDNTITSKKEEIKKLKEQLNNKDGGIDWNLWMLKSDSDKAVTKASEGKVDLTSWIPKVNFDKLKLEKIKIQPFWEQTNFWIFFGIFAGVMLIVGIIYFTTTRYQIVKVK